ncbi:MAG: DUF2934 domain-containing protein [Betaproteobacteria bacterium]|nr:DUF2934 domain-containing protein [Betaproteobacteria bacterium]
MKSGKTIPRQKQAEPSVEPGKRKVRSGARSTVRGAPNGQGVLTPGERRHMIELEAYLRAERRGFAGGTAEEDWFEAEAEIDRMLARSARH